MNKGKIFLCCDRVILVSLCLLIFCLPFSKAAAESFTLLAFISWILKRIFGYRAELLWGLLPKTGLDIVLGIYILINAVSITYSVDFGLSLRAFFGKELKFLAIYFMLVEVINSKKRLKIILIAIIASAMLIIIDAGVMYFKGVDFLRGNKLGLYPFCASFATSIGFAAWLIVIIPVFIGIIAANVFSDLRVKILLSTTVIIQSVYLIGTYCRGGWLGFLAGILFIIYYVLKNSTSIIKKSCIIAVLSLLCISLLLPKSAVLNIKYYIWTNFKFSQLINARLKLAQQFNNDRSSLVRIMLWKESLKIIRDYPFTGCGLNTYSIVARDYKSFEGGGIYPHNSYLQKTTEIGLFGLASFFGVLFIFFKTGLQYFNRKKNYLVLGLLSGILAFLVHAFFDIHLYSLQFVVLFWYMLGLTMAVIKVETNS